MIDFSVQRVETDLKPQPFSNATLKKQNIISKNKRQYPEFQITDDEYQSISQSQHNLKNEKSNVQVDTSTLFPSTSQEDKVTALLIASDSLSLLKKDQKRCIMFANLTDLEPITLTSSTLLLSKRLYSNK